MPLISLPRPNDPSSIVAVINYLWSLAPVTMDESYAHVCIAVDLWVNGDEDPFPDPPPDDKGHRPQPPPDPPPMPAYPLAQLLQCLAACDATAWEGAWTAVLVALDDWQASA